MQFKDKLKSRRLELGLTMGEVAEKVGVSTPTILRYESGDIKNVRDDKIKALADVLKVTPSYLMGWYEYPRYTESFSYYVEMQIPLLGHEIIYDEEDAFVILKAAEGEYEISVEDLEKLSKEMEEFLKFKLFELKQNSRKI